MIYDDHFSKTEKQFFQMMTFWRWTFAVRWHFRYRINRRYNMRGGHRYTDPALL